MDASGHRSVAVEVFRGRRPHSCLIMPDARNHFELPVELGPERGGDLSALGVEVAVVRPYRRSACRSRPRVRCVTR